jgi:hypothetical protein
MSHIGADSHPYAYARFRYTHVRVDPLVTAIPSHAYYLHDHLIDVELPVGLCEIGNNAFQGCSSMKQINLPDGLLRIGSEAFASCTSLTHIRIPKSITSIQYQAFDHCEKLKYDQLNKGLVTIGERAFRHCSLIAVINIPSSVTAIGRSSFKWCASLKDVNLCEGLLRIIFFAFAETPLLRVNIPSSVEYMSHRAFTHCRRLRNIAISPSSTLQSAVLEQMKPFRRITELDCTMDMLKSRFDGLPLHRFCFYHAHPSMGYPDINAWLDNYIRQAPPPAEYSATDCLGMTPLHILSCSGIHDGILYQRIYELNPDQLRIPDDTGKTVIEYILLVDAPPDIFRFFIDTMRKKWGTLPFHFEHLVHKSARLDKGEEPIRKFIQAQRTYFPSLDVNWSRLVDDLRWYGCSKGVQLLLLEASHMAAREFVYRDRILQDITHLCIHPSSKNIQCSAFAHSRNLANVKLNEGFQRIEGCAAR